MPFSDSRVLVPLALARGYHAVVENDCGSGKESDIVRMHLPPTRFDGDEQWYTTLSACDGCYRIELLYCGKQMTEKMANELYSALQRFVSGRYAKNGEDSEC
jgi:hypothetical protein